MTAARPARPLPTIPLDVFLSDYWAPDPGQHVALVGPNGCGKTTVGMQLLAGACEQHPQTTGVALVMKPHRGPKSAGRRASGDATVSRFVRARGGKIIRDWPPPPTTRLMGKPTFYALWPKHEGHPDVDNPAHRDVFQRALVDSYKRGDSWVFADEAAGLSDDLDLADELKQTLSRGRSMNAAALLATQRPRHVPRHMFTEARHFFLWRMNDLGEYERLREIGGGRLSKQDMVGAVNRLSRHQCLYLFPEENVAAILT